MENILQKLIEQKRIEIEQHKATMSRKELQKKVELQMTKNEPRVSLRTCLEQSSTGIIAEFKRKSPSRGWINETADLDMISAGYEANGATALSILTDEPFFGGSLDFIRRARQNVNIPILRKDFILDEYQLFEAKEVGANAVLLIAACLTKKECNKLVDSAIELNLEVLLEVHNETELSYITSGISMVGVNNRNLSTFQTDLKTSYCLGTQIPSEFLKISESGIHSSRDILELRQEGFKGFLIGETFMKTLEPAKSLGLFIENIRCL
ncbi:MAG: indole-3-glycerol phosphate synthase TrpC [Bacteroidaceae bacterium]